ncbi:hypothetical protein D920_02674 [Enterococcus faecalis 13-SD-W-01]|nr:hypothetical protein D920_02674 [Enterococcus faecalis 13-SD-W-01]
MLKLKRVYVPAEKADGYRILIDRLWPRGISKEEAHVDLWLKEAAPSKELRQWFNHQPDRFPSFEEKYQAELKNNDEAKKALAHLEELVQEKQTVTLVYGAKDEVHNQAVVLKKILLKEGCL